eukprot:3531278-Alexandrium_andersonii.AAC.1
MSAGSPPQRRRKTWKAPAHDPAAPSNDQAPAPLGSLRRLAARRRNRPTWASSRGARHTPR